MNELQSRVSKFPSGLITYFSQITKRKVKMDRSWVQSVFENINDFSQKLIETQFFDNPYSFIHI